MISRSLPRESPSTLDPIRNHFLAPAQISTPLFSCSSFLLYHSALVFSNTLRQSVSTLFRAVHSQCSRKIREMLQFLIVHTVDLCIQFFHNFNSAHVEFLSGACYNSREHPTVHGVDASFLPELVAASSGVFILCLFQKLPFVLVVSVSGNS